MKYSFLLVMVLGLCACSSQQASLEAPGVNTFKPSEKFRINLPEDHKDGYTWSLMQDFDRKVLDYEKAVWHGAEKGVDFNFVTSAAGKTELVFYSIRYRDTAAVKHFIVEVK